MCAGSLEHSGESRQDEEQQHEHCGRADDGEKCRIDRRGEELRAELVFALELRRQSSKRAGQVSASFAGAHEAQVEWQECLGVRRRARWRAARRGRRGREWLRGVRSLGGGLWRPRRLERERVVVPRTEGRRVRV